MKNKFAILGFSIVLVLAAFIFGSSFYKEKKVEEITEKNLVQKDLFERVHSPNIGPKNADVTIVEFLDPECESCRAFYPYVKKIMDDYGDQVRLVIRYVPFHKNSRVAIGFLEAARKQDKYWEALELLFFKQPEWGDHHDPKPELIPVFLKTLDLDMDMLRKDAANPETQEWVNQDFLDAKALGVSATPTFFVNGKPLSEFSYEGLDSLVRRELGISL